MDADASADRRIVVECFCICDSHVDTAVAHWCTEAAVPVRAVECFGIGVKIADPGDVWDIV